MHECTSTKMKRMDCKTRDAGLRLFLRLSGGVSSARHFFTPLRRIDPFISSIPHSLCLVPLSPDDGTIAPCHPTSPFT